MKKMNSLIGFCLALAILVLPILAEAQQLTTPPGGGNQKAKAIQYMGMVKTAIVYNSPDVHSPTGDDRRGHIWGELVPYGMNNLGFGTAKESPWRAGANENTVAYFSHDVTIEGKALKAGKYGLHMIVREEGEPWTIIFSNNHSSWGSFFYDPAEDALRVDVTPSKGEYHEWLTYGFEDRMPNSCTATMSWEDVKVGWKIEVPNINELYLATMRDELRSSAGFNFQNWITAANFCITNDVNLEEGLAWAEAAISAPFIGQRNYNTLSTKARVLAKLERTEEAAQVMDEAIHDPSTTVFQIHGYGRQLIGQKKAEEAVKVFEYNKDRFGEVWPVNVGLARGYSAVGNYKKAHKAMLAAQKNVPEGDQVNAGSVERMLGMLAEKKDIN